MNNQFMQMLQQFKANPLQMLMQKRLNVPAEMANDPSAIVNHLLQTKQVTQDTVNRAYQQYMQIRR